MAKGTFKQSLAQGFGSEKPGLLYGSSFCAACGNNPKSCSKQLEAIAKRCKVSKGENRDFVKGREKYRNRSKGKRGLVRNKTWKDKHCGPALMKLNAKNLQQEMEKIEKLGDEMLGEMESYAKDLGWNILTEKGGRFLTRAGVKYGITPLCAAAGGTGGAAAGGVGAVPGAIGGGGVCAIGATIVNVVDGIWTALSTPYEIYKQGNKIGGILKELEAIKTNANSILEAANDEKALEGIQSRISTAMEKGAAASPCLSARKCFLTPYKKPGAQGKSYPKGTGKPGLFDQGLMDLSDSRGCCPGQTGHHLIPEGMLADCPQYTDAKHNAAPVMCVEGVNHSMGSHGKVHTAMDRIVGEKVAAGQRFTMKAAVDSAVDSMNRSGVGSKCDDKCIKEQLKKFYDDIVCDPKPVDKMGKPIVRDSDTDL